MKKYRKNLFTGIMSIIPLAITYWIIENLFIFFSKPGKYLIDKLYSIDLFDQFTFVLKFYDYFHHILFIGFGVIPNIYFIKSNGKYLIYPGISARTAVFGESFCNSIKL